MCVGCSELLGPSATWRWLTWQSLTEAQRARRAAAAELQALLPADKPAARRLTPDTVQAVLHNIKHKHGRDVDAAFVHETYEVLHKIHFLDLGRQSAAYCASRFGQPENSASACLGDRVFYFL